MMLLGLVQSEIRHLLAVLFYGVGVLSLLLVLRHGYRVKRRKRKEQKKQPNPALSGRLQVQAIELRERFLKQRSSLMIPRDGSLTDPELSAILSRLRRLQPDRNK